MSQKPGVRIDSRRWRLTSDSWLLLIARFIERRLYNPRAHLLVAHDHVELTPFGRQRCGQIAHAEVLAERRRGHAGRHIADPLAIHATNIVAAAGDAALDHLEAGQLALHALLLDAPQGIAAD